MSTGADCGCTTGAAPTFIGWWRPTARHRWERVCQGADEAAVFRELLAQTLAGDVIVRRSGDGPPGLKKRS
jgi:hypothetical protein